MKARHVSYIDLYRKPFGAAVLGESVFLAVDTWEGMARSCELRLWQEGVGEKLLPMRAVESSAPDEGEAPCRRFEVTFSPDTLGVLWYSFRIVACDGSVVWLGAPDGWVTGVGVLRDCSSPSFQMTVFQPREGVKPNWYKNGIVYQIFPDRFARGGDWPTRAKAALDVPRRGPSRRLLDDWDTPPTYDRTPTGEIATWDFYGGSFAGIRERLDYLQDLGVTVLYLNPIFEAASNHRYDTADYMAIDPMLGTLDDFRALCDDARAHGMSIILDGVFNHSGQDSRYFNAYGNYADCGAAQGEDSPYRSWYHFHEDGSYESWWGVRDLPEYNENDPSLREFFCGENGVVRTWLRAGAAGWRLDVADELPDSFIADIKAAALAEKPDALIIGEVWEDASNKYAYGELRHYFQGAELDGAMNYPFRTTVIGYLTGRIHAPEAAAQLRQIAENYPPESLACCLNLLGSHDRERILTMLGDAPRNDELTEEERAKFQLTPDQRDLAINRSRLAVLLQMSAPGVPSVYYGDEAGLEGYRDPFNRATMPWDNIDQGIFDFYRSSIALRKSMPLLVDGAFEPVAFGNEVLGWWRRARVAAEAGATAAATAAANTEDQGESVLVLVNRSPWDWANVSVAAEGECVSELARAQVARIEDGRVNVSLPPFGCSVLYFHTAMRLQKPLAPGKGLIAHLTSVPNAAGPGTLGKPAHAFVDWLACRGYTYWQMLPVNPTDEFDSPYAGLSAFAGNPALIERTSDKDAFDETAYQDFCNRNTAWLAPYATFRAIKKLQGEITWQEWPEPYRTWSPELAERPELQDEIERVRREQFTFQTQWDDARHYANAKGIKIIGDLPIYVSADSADVWAHTDLFDLDEAGNPAGLAGVPPDNLAADGQIWGNPTYRWDRMAADGYEWWMQRLARMFALYDYVRLDHFLGFSSYYVIPADKSAKEGSWKYGPGKALFDCAASGTGVGSAYQNQNEELVLASPEKFWDAEPTPVPLDQARKRFGGGLPLIGENLGTITPAVRALVARCGFPGMDVIQFSDTDPREGYEPAPNSIVYLSTHDTQTLVGWCETRYELTRKEARALAQGLIERTQTEQQDRVVMMQLQDALFLGDEARMNTPGTTEGNWAWQMMSGEPEQ